MIDLTWDDVRERSAKRVGAYEAYCYNCRMNYDVVQMPCLRHCADEGERMERHRFMPKVEAEIVRTCSDGE